MVTNNEFPNVDQVTKKDRLLIATALDWIGLAFRAETANC